MLVLADWFGLTYYMLKEESPSSHIILVEDQEGRKATFCLESGAELTNELSPKDREKASAMIQDSMEDFLEYWNEQKQLKPS